MLKINAETSNADPISIVLLPTAILGNMEDADLSTYPDI